MSRIDAARAACEATRWADAWRVFSELDRDRLDIDDLDLFATSAYLTGHDEEGFTLWGLAHQRCIDEGMIHRAALFGMRLARSLGFKGDMPRAAGWVDRTARLLEEAEIDCVEQGYLEHALGLARVFEAGDLGGALGHFEQAEKIAGRFSDRELATLARITIGRMKIYLGDHGDGISLLDEAMVSIEADELSTLSTGDAYCTVIDACWELSDVARCRAWTESMKRWCDRHQGLVLYRGHCFIHGAEVLAVTGRWSEALDEARRACDHLARPLPAVVGAATRLEADVLRLLGRLDEADVAYDGASELGHEPQPGLALLRLAQGQIDASLSMMRRVFAEANDPVSRSRLLAPYVEIALEAGDIDASRQAAEELRSVAGELGSTYLRAEAALATGAVRLFEGDAADALPELRVAFRAFDDLEAAPRAARTRQLIADACEALGDDQTAAMERRAAQAAFESFLAASPEGPPDPLAPPDGLTERELEVLRLLACGKTNRTIGDELFISEKTVASHVSHIFTKIDVTSRAAATAYAYDHGLR